MTFRDVIAKKPPTIKAVEIQSLVFLWFAVCWRAILSLFDIDIDDDSPILGSEDRRNTFLKETTTHERTEN